MHVHTHHQCRKTWIQPHPTCIAPHAHFFLRRNPAWPKQVFGLWNFETDQLSEDGKHCFYMIYLWWEMNYGGSSPSEFLSISWAFECLFEKKTDGSKWTTLDANVWPPSQLHAATKNSKRTLIVKLTISTSLCFCFFLWSSHIMGRYRFEYHLMHCHFTTCRACSFQADPWWKITQIDGWQLLSATSLARN